MLVGVSTGRAGPGTAQARRASRRAGLVPPGKKCSGPARARVPFMEPESGSGGFCGCVGGRGAGRPRRHLPDTAHMGRGPPKADPGPAQGGAGLGPGLDRLSPGLCRTRAMPVRVVGPGQLTWHP